MVLVVLHRYCPCATLLSGWPNVLRVGGAVRCMRRLGIQSEIAHMNGHYLKLL